LADRATSYAAQQAAGDLAISTKLLQAQVATVAAVPGIAQVLEHPDGCKLSFTALDLFTAGHYDLVRPDGSIVCSSRAGSALPGAAGYAELAWLPEALASPILDAPSLDPATGLLGIMSASPIPAGGAVVAFVDLAPVGVEVARRYGGDRHLEFLVTTARGQKVLSRSREPARWIGASLVDSAFAAPASAGQRADLDGIPRLYSTATAAGTGWQVYAGATVSETLAAANGLFRQELEILLAGLGLVALGTFFVYRKITQPLTRLSSAVRAATVRADRPPLGVEGPAELRTLAADINALIGSSARELAVRRRAEVEVSALNSGLEARVAQRTEQLEAANRDLEAFSYTVAHDLRAPLRAIDGFADILLSEHAAELSSEGVRHLGRVRQAATQMSDLIRDLLEFSRLTRTELHRRPVEMRPLVDSVVATLKAASPGRRVKVAIGPLPACFGDESLLEQVLVNLLSNSWKFTASSKDATVDIGSELVAGVPAYFVRDNGVGFNPAYTKKIFDVFQRAHRAEDFPGTGVGLAIVKRIVFRHGGQVWADSQPGQGATFHFTIGAALGG
ncbi:MAG: ATP-binding protein, partial [Candidatus Dormibacteraeota bacterium]|nr:ATP-binding protein [Candidatus Dormibacteraeota bacterium]